MRGQPWDERRDLIERRAEQEVLEEPRSARRRRGPHSCSLLGVRPVCPNPSSMGCTCTVPAFGDAFVLWVPWDSNPQPTGEKPGALPVELRARDCDVSRDTARDISPVMNQVSTGGGANASHLSRRIEPDGDVPGSATFRGQGRLETRTSAVRVPPLRLGRGDSTRSPLPNAISARQSECVQLVVASYPEIQIARTPEQHPA